MNSGAFRKLLQKHTLVYVAYTKLFQHWAKVRQLYKFLLISLLFQKSNRLNKWNKNTFIFQELTANNRKNSTISDLELCVDTPQMMHPCVKINNRLVLLV